MAAAQLDVAAPREPVLPTTRRGRRVVFAILLVALLLRFGVVAASRNYLPLTDSVDYDRIALSLSNGQGFPDASLPFTEGPSALRAPLYPISLGVVYVVFPHHFTAGRLANAFLGTLAVALLGIVAALIWSRRFAAVAMAIAAVYPAMLLTGSVLVLEPLLVSLSLATLAAALQHRRSGQGLRWAVVAGVLLGLTVLTRELGWLFVPPIAWLLWTGTPRWSWRALKAPLVFVGMAVLVVSPWVIRSAVQLDAFVPTTTSAGYGLAGTYNETAMNDPDHPARWIEPGRDPAMAEIILEDPNRSEVELDRDLRDEVVDLIRDNPQYPIKAAFWGTQRFLDLDGGAYSRDIVARYIGYPSRLTTAAVLSFYVVLALAIIGAFLPAARKAPFAVWLIPILIFVFTIFTLPASIRYRASLEPYFIFLATGTLLAGWDRWQARRGPERKPEAVATG